MKGRDHLLSHGLQSYHLQSYRGVGHSVSMEIVRDAAAIFADQLPHSDTHIVPPPSPRTMSVKELKEAIRDHGLTQKAVGLTEKAELVEVVEDFYRVQGLSV
jgi:hypothetical protein